MSRPVRAALLWVLVMVALSSRQIGVRALAALGVFVMLAFVYRLAFSPPPPRDDD